MELVELIHTPASATDTVASAQAFCARIGKTAIHCPDQAGFLVNRLLFTYLAAALWMLARTDIDITATDTALSQGFGFPAGPYSLLDIVGPDTSQAIHHQLHNTFPTPTMASPPLLDQAVTSQLLGRKNEHGLLEHPRQRQLP